MTARSSPCTVVLAALLAFVASASREARGDEAPSRAPAPLPSVTFREALEYARQHQPRIRAALSAVAAERARAEVPSGQWQPSVGAAAQLVGATANNTTTNSLGASYVDLPRIGATRSASLSDAKLQPYASTLVAVGVSQELFDFGRIAAQTAAADALVAVRSHEADAEKLDMELDVEEAFFAVQAAKAVLAASEGAVERARVHRDQARAGVQSGLRPPIEQTRAEADLQKFETGSLRARGALATAQSVLAAAIGSPEPALDAAGPPPSRADMPALAAAVQQASARDPILLRTLAQLKAQEERTRAIGAEMRPNLALTAAVSGRAGGAPPSSGPSADAAGFLPSVPNWDVGLVLDWPLFDGTVSARKKASAAEEQVRRDAIAVERERLAAGIRQAYVAVDVARSTLPGLERQLEAAVANYAQADARFKSGLGTSVELADAEALRARSEIDLAIGRFELAKARAAFGRAIAEGL